MLQEGKATEASMESRLNYRNRHALIERILRKAESGASLESISRYLGQSQGKTGSELRRLHEWGMLRQDGTAYATTDKGRGYGSAVGIMNGILDRRHSPEEIPGLVSRIESLIPGQRQSIYDYGNLSPNGGGRQAKKDILARSRINMTHDVLTAMASSPMTRNGIRRITRFDTTPEGNMELELLMESLIANKLIMRANAHQITTEAYRITDNGWKVKGALGSIISATSA